MNIAIVLLLIVLSVLWALWSLKKQNKFEELPKAKKELMKKRVVYHKDSLKKRGV